MTTSSPSSPTRLRLPGLHISASLVGLMIGLFSPFVQAQGQAPVEAAIERQAERARQQAAERILNRAESIQERTTERIQDRAQQAQQQAVERVRNRQTEQIQDRVAGRSSEILSNRLPERLPIIDGQGNPAFVEIEIAPDIRVVENQWIMLIRENQRGRLEEQAPELMRFLSDTQPFEADDSEVLIFTVPPDLDTDDRILELVPADMRHLIDRNHIYTVEAEAGGGREDASTVPLDLPIGPVCEDPMGVGIIDSVIQVDHPAFAGMAQRGKSIISRDFISTTVDRPPGHGTAVAGLLVGEGEGLRPLLPGATLFTAGVVYSRDAFHQGATVSNLLSALNWLLRQDISVINMSLAGPPNRLLSQALETAVNRGRLVVAAVGNEGPHAPPQFPAAYDHVISATSVTRERGIYRWANQGDYVDFAALGVSVPTARADGSFGRESGTSMAAPVVTAFLACSMRRHRNIRDALEALKDSAIDLGAPGHDPVFGHGLLHP